MACCTRRESTRSSAIGSGNAIGSPQRKLAAKKTQLPPKAPQEVFSIHTARTNGTRKKPRQKSDESDSSLRKMRSVSRSTVLPPRQSGSSSRSRNGEKRPKLSDSFTTATATTDSEMWIDKYAPRTAEELCVAPKKVEEVRSFLARHASRARARRRRRPEERPAPAGKPWDAPAGHDNDGAAFPAAALLLLTGSPGIGKSAAVRALAREMRMEVRAWHDAPAEYRPGGGERRDGAYLPYQSQLRSFEEFLRQGSAGLEALEVDGTGGEGSTGEGSSSDDEDGGWERADERGQKRRNDYVGSLILIEEVSRAN